MTLTIRPVLPAAHNYCGTFFDDLAVTIFESNPAGSQDKFAKMIDEILGSSVARPDATPFTLPPTVMKRFQPSDRRYNAFHKDWKLDELIRKLEEIDSFGAVAEKGVEKHEAFTIERERPEDRLVKVSSRGICLNEWPFEPLYRVGEHSSLLPAIEALRQISLYLQSQGTR